MDTAEAAATPADEQHLCLNYQFVNSAQNNFSDTPLYLKLIGAYNIDIVVYSCFSVRIYG